MKPVLQNRVAPKPGNCASACIASIFEIPIESVFDGDSEKNEHDADWWFGLREWLLARNLMFAKTSFGPFGYSVAVGPSPRLRDINGKPEPHACVALDGNLVHDPHPTGAFFAGEKPYEYWVFYLVDPTKPIGVGA